MIRSAALNCFVVLLLVALALPGYAQSQLNENVATSLQGIAGLFKDNFNSSQTLGEPVEAGDYVIIPVVVKAAGFGFGTKLEALDSEKHKDQLGKSENKHKDRFGLGGGIFVRPVALIVIKKGGDFQLIKLNEGFMNTLAKKLAPAMAKMMKETILSLVKMRQKNRNKEHKALQHRPMRNLRRGLAGPAHRMRPPMPPAKDIIIEKQIRKEGPMPPK